MLSDEEQCPARKTGDAAQVRRQARLVMVLPPAGTYAVIVAIDAPNAVVAVAVPCSACVGGLSAGAEVRSLTSSSGQASLMFTCCTKISRQPTFMLFWLPPHA